jgi:imidazolonepropionase-like amidohydrolase
LKISGDKSLRFRVISLIFVLAVILHRMRLLIIIIYLFSSLIVVAQHHTAITNVTVIDVQSKKLLHGKTVFLADSIIVAISPSGTKKLPDNTQIIDGGGKYLMPGMVDAHVHFFMDGSLYSNPDWIDLRKFIPYEIEMDSTKQKMEDFLRRYLQCGITTVVDLGSTFNFLKLRDSLDNGYSVPTVYMAGPLITTVNLEHFIKNENDDVLMYGQNIEEAKAAVQKQLNFHPDLIKIIYVAIDPTGKHQEDTARKLLPFVKTIIEEAHRNNLKVAVHATQLIPAKLAVEAGCDYLAHGIDDQIISEDFVGLLKKKNVTVCPTLNVTDGYYKTFIQDNNFSSYQISHSNPFSFETLFALQDINSSFANRIKQNAIDQTREYKNQDSIRMVNLKKLSDAEIPIASGTDAGNIRTLHASFYLAELLSMRSCGMSNWQVIEAATINPLKILGKENKYGSISVGKIADMILLDKNPVDNLNNLAEISMVFKKGKAIIPDTLIKKTPEMVVAYQVNAFNSNNLETFLDYYDTDVEVYNFPGSLVGTGRNTIKKMYEPFFNSKGNMHLQIKSRSVLGNLVIDNEAIKTTGEALLERVIIYSVENSKIKKLYVIR